MKLLSLTGAVLLISYAVVGEALKSDCTLKWRFKDNTQVIGLIKQGAITSEEDCKKACVKIEECWNVDWDFEENSCWHGTQHRPTDTIPNNNVNHYDLDCEVATTPPPTTAPPTTQPPTTQPPTTLASPTGEDCTAIRRKYKDAKNGVYSITVPGQSNPVPVYCEMETGPNGWTVIQRRKDGSVNFKRNWSDYANGFGSLKGEFWLGNEYISALTNARTYRLRVELVDWNGVYTYAEYNDFKVAGAADKYRLTFSNCSYFGTASNALGSTAVAGVDHNGMKFSTIDQDNDNWATGSCSNSFHGGWWYNNCHWWSNLNGEYNNTKRGEGITWNVEDYSYKVTELDIRSA